QGSIRRVPLQFFAGHAVEERVDVDLLCALDPLPAGVDLGVSRYGTDHGRSIVFYAICSLDDLLQCEAHVSAALCHQTKGMSMPTPACLNSTTLIKVTFPLREPG